MNKNEIFRARIEGYTSEGAGVCRADGMAVFVPRSVRGDECEVRVTKVQRSHAYGRVERLITSSPERREPPCPHFGKCGGCDFWHMSYEEELRLKQQRVADALRRIGGFDLPLPEIVAGDMHAYRNKAQLPLRRIGGRTRWGFYRSRSHELEPLEGCLIQQPQVAELAQAVCDWADKYGISVYDEEKHNGLLRTVYIRSGSGGVHFCLVATARPPHTDKLVQALRARCRTLCGAVLNLNAAAGNRILGERCETLWGEDKLTDELLGRRFELSPLSFYQVNRAQTERLYTHVAELCRGSERMLDLYCGVGTITLTAGAECGHIIGAEIVPDAVRDARRNAEINGAENAEFICSDAGEAAQELARRGFAPQTVICDPPRRGMDAQTVAALLKMAPERIVCVSCDSASLARDARLLAESYRITHLRAFDMFPRTANVETVCCLYHQKKDFISVPYEPKNVE
ncbi:MAG: 23S rRNA (uracil(1939)-C(5))-methyltransferase RlmD [Clostridia bacterium]|nr:23S rRNA (uracil(1939)-C(5))-methyltransferase RlmD [Clostridia bacterium]